MAPLAANSGAVRSSRHALTPGVVSDPVVPRDRRDARASVTLLPAGTLSGPPVADCAAAQGLRTGPEKPVRGFRSAEQKEPYTATTLLRAARQAAVCEDFIRLSRDGHYTLTGAAKALGVSPSLFSGAGSLLQRYMSGGTAALAPQSRGEAAESELSRRIELLGWFVVAANFFFFSSNRRYGALAKAVRRAAALPRLPVGWRRETRAKFLRHLGTQSAPECPKWLKQEIQERERSGKTALPPRIIRLIRASPATLRRQSFSIGMQELPSFPFQIVARQFAQSQPAGSCLLYFELLAYPTMTTQANFAPGRIQGSNPTRALARSVLAHGEARREGF